MLKLEHLIVNSAHIRPTLLQREDKEELEGIYSRQSQNRMLGTLNNKRLYPEYSIHAHETETITLKEKKMAELKAELTKHPDAPKS